MITINVILFLTLAVAMLVLSVFAITTKSLLRSATCLLLVLICTAGIYLFLNYHFLAAIQVSIYAGGVVILFVFAIFLTIQKDEVLLAHERKRYVYAALTVLVGIGITGLMLWKSRYLFYNGTEMSDDTELDMHVIGQTLMGTEKYQYLLPFEVLSVLLLACIIGGILIAKKNKGNQL
jgi:NADH-quinone oxidoreductase subunit J